MNCNEVCEKMYDYIENQLSQQDLKSFEEHMKNCTHCQQQYEQTEKLLIKLKNIKDVEPPKHLKYKILDNIKKEEKSKKIIYFKKYSYVAAAIAIFVCSFYTLKIIENYTQKATLYTNSQNNKTKTRQIEQSSEQQVDLQQPAKASRSIDTQNNLTSDNQNNNYFYTKNITKDENTKIFKYDIALYKNYICNISFENNDNENVVLYVEDIDGNKISQDTFVLKNDTANMEFYITNEDFEEGVFTIVAETKGKSLNGLLNIEILQN